MGQGIETAYLQLSLRKWICRWTTQCDSGVTLTWLRVTEATDLARSTSGAQRFMREY